MRPYRQIGRWYHLVRRHAVLLALVTVVSGVLFVVSPFQASALTTVPTKMNFQGRLTDTSGNIKPNGTYNMKLRLYTVASNGSPVWSEDRLVSASQGITVTNGLFSIKLGDITSLPASLFASGDLYLEVELPTPATATSSSPTWTEGPMTPRNQLATSAYAYNAETLDGLDSASLGQLSANNVWTGTNTFNVLGANAFRVQNGSAVDVLNIDTSTATMTVSADTTIAAGKSLTVVGGNTASRPASPTEGMIYYDQTTDQLLTYANGKWQADRTGTIIVAASNSNQADKDAADYVADGNTGGAADGDQVQINAALTAAAGKKVFLLAGTYTVDASITLPSNATLVGSGASTLITIPNSHDAALDVMSNADTTNGNANITLSDLSLDGNDSNNTDFQKGIRLTGGGVALKNIHVNRLIIQNFSGAAIESSAYEGEFSGNTIRNNNWGMNLFGGSAVVTGNLFTANVDEVIYVYESNGNVISNNIITGGDSGIYIESASNNTITANTISSSTRGIYLDTASNNLVSANSLYDNGGSTTNNAIYLNNADSNTITNNNVTDSSATTNNYAINIFNAGSDTNYNADNTLGGGSINDAGTGTIYGGQVNGSGNYVVQPAGTIELMKNTTVQGGTLTLGNSSTQGSLVISDGSSNTATIQVGSLAGNYTYTIPVTTASDTFCMQTLANCASGGGVSTVGALDGGTANATGATISGSTLYLQSASGTNPGLVNTTTQTFAGNKTFNGTLSVNDVSVAAGKSVTIVGGNTASRPASPAEGMIYYDTTTKQLLTYANGKWQADRETNTKIVAASNSSQAAKDAADYVAAGTNSDEDAINAALTAVAASGGGTVHLLEGTYIVDGSIVVSSNITLAGSGVTSIIQAKNSLTYTELIMNSDTTNGNDNITIKHLLLDGNKSNGASASGINFFASGANEVENITIEYTTIQNFDSSPAYLYATKSQFANNKVYNNDSSLDFGGGPTGYGSDSQFINNHFEDGPNYTVEIYLNNSYIAGNTFRDIDGNTLELYGGSHNIVTNNTFEDVGNAILLTHQSDSTITANTISGDTYKGIVYSGSSDRNLVSSNTITTTSVLGGNQGINIGSATSDNNVLSGNRIAGFETSINDAGTGTVFGGQLDGSGNLINTIAGGFSIAGAASTAKFNVSNLLNVDSSTGKVSIGTSDTTGTVFVLDIKTDTGDPTGTIGAMYYNSNAGKFRCYEGATWKDCITASSSNADTLDTLDSTDFGRIASANTFTGVNAFNGTTFSIGGTANAAKFNVASLFNVDSSASKVSIGASDTTGTILVLDTKTDAGDPTGTIGAMYYNSNAGKFRCYQGASWTDCISASSSNADTLDTLDSTDFGRIASTNTFTGVNSFDGATFSIGGTANAAKFNVASLFNVDSSASKISIGASDTTGTVLVLDVKTDSGDPTGTIGAMYYNSNAGKFRCYQGAAWADCITTAPATSTSQTAYTASTGGTTPEIKLDSTRGGFDIQDADSTTGGSLFAVRASNGAGLGAALFDITSTGVTTLKNTSNSTAAFSIQNVAAASLFKVGTSDQMITLGTAGDFDAPTKLTNPATLPAGDGKETAWSPNGQYMSVAHATTPFVTIYKRSGDTFTKLADPATLPPAQGNGTAWSPDGQYMSVAHQTSPFITIYKRSGDTFTKLADPATLPAGIGRDTSWSLDGQYMTVAHDNSPFITIYKRSGDTFTKLADPATLPDTGGSGTAWSPDGQYMSVAGSGSPYITIYKRSGDTFTKLADPATLPTLNADETAWSPDGQYMSVTFLDTPYIFIYKRSGDTFTKLADPATLPAGVSNGTAWSPDGQYMSVTHVGSPYITIYERSGDTFTKLADPATLPTDTGRGVSWSPDGQYMSVAHDTSPYTTIYKGSGQKIATDVQGNITISNNVAANSLTAAYSVTSQNLITTNLQAYNANIEGGLAALGGITVGTSDTTGTVFVLDTKTGAGDPTGTVGAMYYNSNAGKFRCYQGAAWVDCITTDLLATNNTFTGTQAFNGTTFSIGGAANAAKFNVASLFNVDSTNSIISIGASDTTGTVLVLDTKTGAGDPTGVAGAMYYNSNAGKFRCYQNGAWVDCTIGESVVLKTADQNATSSSTTFQNVTDMTFALATNSTYTYEISFFVNVSNTTADLKYTLVATNATSIAAVGTTSTSATTMASCALTAVAGTSCAVASTATGMILVTINGVVKTNGTATSLQLQFAQNASNAAVSPTALANSYIRYIKHQ